MTASSDILSTSLTKLLGIQHPIILAGMNVAAGPELAAAVSNAGGLGVIGGVGYTPKMLRMKIEEIKEELKDPNAPFGVDLLLPQVGGSARKTNTDYTQGTLPELIDIIIESKAKLFVSAVGVPPKHVIPVNKDMKAGKLEKQPVVWLAGAVSGALKDILPAKQIVDEMVSDAVAILRSNVQLITSATASAPASRL